VLEGTPAVLGREDSGGTSIASRERRKEHPAPRDYPRGCVAPGDIVCRFTSWLLVRTRRFSPSLRRF
jgi:hypothetical protein